MTPEELESSLLEGIDVREEPKPLSVKDRFIIQNLFDTQPLKREQYLKEIGWEMSPDDDNLVRPLGSTGPFETEIDPGITAYFKKGGLAEVGKDLGDAAYDLLAGALTSAGAAKAGVAGTASGAAFGPGAAVASPVLGFISAVLGGAAGNMAAEELKAGLANAYTDKDIPMEQRDALAQSLISGVMEASFPMLTRAGRATFKKLDVAGRWEAMKAAFKAGGGLTNPQILEKAAANPTGYAPEIVDGARKRTLNKFRELMGLDPEQTARVLTGDPDAPLPDGTVAKIMTPLKQEQQKAYEMLSQNPQANVKLADAIEAMKGRFVAASQLSPVSLPDDVRQGRDKLKDILSEFFQAKGIKISPKEMKEANIEDLVKKAGGAELNYRELRNLVSRLQEKSFDNATRTDNVFLKNLARDGRVLSDQIAERVAQVDPNIPNVPQINSELNSLFDAYKNFVDATGGKGERLIAVELGGDLATDDQNAAKAALETFAKAIKKPEIAKEFEDLGAQVWFEKIYKKPTSAMQDPAAAVTAGRMAGFKGGLVSGLAAGSAVAAPVALASPPAAGMVVAGTALAGGIRGASQGAQRAALMANPQNIIPELINLNQATQTSRQIAESFAKGTGQATNAREYLNQVLGMAIPQSAYTGQTTTPAEANDEQRQAQMRDFLLEGIDE